MRVFPDYVPVIILVDSSITVSVALKYNIIYLSELHFLRRNTTIFQQKILKKIICYNSLEFIWLSCFLPPI
jgi:hypothetical protein